MNLVSSKVAMIVVCLAVSLMDLRYFLVVVNDFILFTKYGNDGGECARKEFVDGACKGYGSVICDNCGVVILMMEYGDVMFLFARYCFMVVTL